MPDAPSPAPPGPPPSSPKGLLLVLGLLVVIGAVIVWIVGDAWMWFFPRS